MNKNSISLSLTEPVIFLRSGPDSASRRRRAGRAEYPPALLRGLLTLKFVKPTRVTSIEVTLEGISRTDWPDVGGTISTRRMEITEENTFLKSKLVLFNAESQKRSRTVGPGVPLESDRRSAANASGDSLDAAENARGRATRRGSNQFESMRPQPLAAFNDTEGLPVVGESSRPSLSVEIPGRTTTSDLSLQNSRTTGPSTIDQTEIPPVYSAVSPTTANSTSAEPREAKTSRRRSARLSLGGMLHDVKGIVQGHSKHATDSENIALQATVEQHEPPDDSCDTRGRPRGRKDKSTITRIGEVFGIDMGDSSDEDNSDMNGKVFKPGTYNYPISFPLPVDLPASIEADFGSVQYKLKAVVHRPGTFSLKLTAMTPVELIAAPAEDDTDEGDAVVIERQWDMELRYLISISGRNFPQGSEIPWQIQLMPLSKMKLYRLTFLLEEKIEYVVHHHRITRSEGIRRYQLLSIRHPQSLSNVRTVARNAPPLLPVATDDSNSSEAVLLEYADPPLSLAGEQSECERKAEALAHLLSPDGPWHLHGVIRVPQTYLHVSHKHPHSFVSIKHALKVVMRVERGGDESVDPKTGKKKQFDIIIETPVHILSKYCRPDWASLPPYETLDLPPMSDAEHLEEDAHIGSLTAESSQSDVTGGGVFSVPMSPVLSPSQLSRPTTPTGESPRPSVGPSTPTDLNDPLRGRRVEASQRFASLVAGFEDEGGELPPTYQSVAGVPGPSRVIRVLPSPTRISTRNKSRSRERSRNRGSRNSSRVPERGTALLFQHT